ncbi:MAG: hypothetical protein V4556_07670 [Bacteroidota bacterium]
MKINLIIFLLGLIVSLSCNAQLDTALSMVTKYTNQIDKKIGKYGYLSNDKTKDGDSILQTILQKPDKYIDSIINIGKAADELIDFPGSYLKKVDAKIDKYSSRISSKTEKTLLKLCKWEKKIHKILQKTNPELAKRLFNSTQTTFSSLLQKIKKGEELTLEYKAEYDKYRDKLSTHLKYLESQKDKLDSSVIEPLNNTNEKVKNLAKVVDNTDAIEQYIKERKQLLLSESLKFIGNNKYLKKISKETYYYVETIKNYKQLFSDPAKVEVAVVDMLNKIPGFKNFTQENSQLSAMFGLSSSSSLNDVKVGLPSRAIVESYIKNKVSKAGSNAMAGLTQNIQQAKSEMQALKDKANKFGTKGDAAIPDFKPNSQKSKIFLQRLEYGADLQFSKSNSLLPGTGDVALKIGYKLNDKSTFGIGASYKVGLGSNNRINITHQGIGTRSFIDWKLKKQFFLTGGYEMNYNSQFKNFNQLNNSNGWKQSGLIGLTKKTKIDSKWFKMSNIQLLYDFLSKQKIPFTQPIIFRVGYNF